ncbi:MAG: phosphodiester glycosidase family protein [Roseiflexaceae bacterium]|nr:phosphodiester glycosidase family protein [Roseiflexaceae bacterium]
MVAFPKSLGLLFALLVAACGNPAAGTPTRAPRPVATLRPTIALPVVTPVSQAAEAVPDTGWTLGSSGVELRTLSSSGEQRVSITIARLDVALVRLRVGYAPDEPRSLASWAEQGQPLLVVNGGFFDEQFQTTALLISDGMASGSSYQGFGGMLTVAPGGEVGLQPLRDQPYDPAQPLDQAMQAFPMLVFPGAAMPGVVWDDERERRTALAVDREGRLLIIVSALPSFSLNEFSDWLLASDLQIDRALNLDGGASTGMIVRAGAAQGQIDPFSRLPIVLIVQAKG